jgi:flagellar hook assembly protein FlgD
VEIPFSLRRPQAVTLQVFDTRGRLVRTLLQEDVPAGTHRLVWTGVDRSGRSVASGVYHVRMDAGPERLTRSVTLVR